MKASPDHPNTRSAIMVRALLVLSVAVALLLAIPWTAGAANNTAPLVIKDLKISVWPEYDDPRVLVIYEGEFADSSAFPQEVTFNTVLGSELKQVCALTKPDNNHECQTFKALEEDGYLAVNYTLPIPTFYLEYYYPGITGQPDANITGQTDKKFNFSFKSPYDIQTLNIEVQQPLRTSGWTVNPTPASVASDAQGFRYNDYTISNVAAGRVISIDASYTKSNADIKPSVAPSTAGGGSADRTPLLISIVLSLAALGGIGWLLFSGRRRRPYRKPAPAFNAKAAKAARIEQSPVGRQDASPDAKGSRPARTGQVPATQRRAAPAARPSSGPIPRAFCSACGSKLDEGGAFCPGCGAEANGSV